MLRALKLHQLPSGCAVNSPCKIGTRNWSIPPVCYRKVPKPIPAYVHPEVKRVANLRAELYNAREREILAWENSAARFVEGSRARRILRKARELPKIYYFLGVVGISIFGTIWYSWYKDRKKVKNMREATRNVQLTEEMPEVLVLDKTELPRPLVLVGPSSSLKSALFRSLVQGREGLFGVPVLHTTRDPRNKDVEGEQFWFAPPGALSQGVYSGAFVSHGDMRVGDKKIGYGLSKGAVADVRLSGHVCLLDLDVEHAEVLSKTDLRPLIVLVMPDDADTPCPDDITRAKSKKNFFHLQLSAKQGGKSLDAARDEILSVLDDQFEQALRIQKVLQASSDAGGASAAA